MRWSRTIIWFAITKRQGTTSKWTECTFADPTRHLPFKKKKQTKTKTEQKTIKQTKQWGEFTAADPTKRWPSPVVAVLLRQELWWPPPSFSNLAHLKELWWPKSPLDILMNFETYYQTPRFVQLKWSLVLTIQVTRVSIAGGLFW